MILLSLASKQIWPQVLAVAHLKPSHLCLLHSEDAAESRGPAQRLKRFFDNSGLVPKGGTRLEQIPHSDFNDIEHHLDELAAVRQLNLGECLLNFTGGNKLMATAAILLKLGVPTIQRGLRLKVKSATRVSTRLPHAESDLLFNWAGRLWLVDCKDRRAPEDFIQKLRRELPTTLTDCDGDAQFNSVGNAVNAERQWRLILSAALFRRFASCRECGERRKAMETHVLAPPQIGHFMLKSGMR